MTTANNTSPISLRYRDPRIIGDIAIVEAQRREENSERAGQLYMLGEILTALHRQAVALEAIKPQLENIDVHIRSWLPSP